MTVLLALPLGAVIGALLGLLGGGGSILLVPGLVYLGGLHPHHAVPTSLIVVAAVSAAAALPKVRAHQVHWRYAGLFVAVGVPSAMTVGALSGRVPQPVLMGGFAAVMVLAATQMLTRSQVETLARGDLPRAPTPGPWEPPCWSGR